MLQESQERATGVAEIVIPPGPRLGGTVIEPGHSVVLMLAAAQGMRVKVKCEGEGAQQCLDEIAALIANKFGEPR